MEALNSVCRRLGLEMLELKSGLEAGEVLGHVLSTEVPFSKTSNPQLFTVTVQGKYKNSNFSSGINEDDFFFYLFSPEGHGDVQVFLPSR